jgi:hypothetical protein
LDHDFLEGLYFLPILELPVVLLYQYILVSLERLFLKPILQFLDYPELLLYPVLLL